MKVLGVTGKVASGKSTVSSYIKKIKKDVLMLDVDKIAKEIYLKNPEILKKLGYFFGKEIFNSEGNLIFKLLAKKVFSSKSKLKKLNKLMFPLIRNEVKGILNKNLIKKYAVIDAAVLFDCKLDLLCDYIILVKNSIKRKILFLKDNGYSDDDIELRIKGQHIRVNKNKVTFIIDNNNSKKSLLGKVEKILRNI